MDRSMDFEGEGLLDGCEGEAREQRRELLEFLVDRGVTLEELKRANAVDRLPMLATERALAGEAKYTVADIAELSGLPVDFLLEFRRAIGVARPQPDERVFGEDDLRTAQLVSPLLGVASPERALETFRVLGRGLSAAARSIRETLAGAFLESAADERRIALRGLHATEQLLPAAGPLMHQILRLHLLEQIRQDQITMAQLRSSDRLPGTRDIAVGFADLVGFTRLGERLGVDELEEVATRLEAWAAELVEPPVQLIKSIGDAVMLVSFEPAPLVDVVSSLVDRAAANSEGDFPPLRAGLAFGTATNHSGDWYGRPVNLASRITGAAPAGAVVCTDALRQLTAERYRWTAAGARTFKGIEGDVPVFRLERTTTPP